MTYSIVARDADTGEMGVAVQTFNLAVGTWVPWAQGGVGAVATQALAERSYGTLGLRLIQGGTTASDALTALLAVDAKRDYRQVSMLDKTGQLATHTGKRCFPEAGSHLGADFCTQANMMAQNTVWDAMADAYRSACEDSGDLADRLVAALEAGEAAGGDMRGRQSAALIVVGPEHSSIPRVDLRVDHHPQPVGELRRLLRLHRAYTAERRIAAEVDAGSINTDAAYETLGQIATLAPDEPYLTYLSAMHLAGRLDRWEEGVAMLRTLVEEEPIWAEYLRREARVDNFGLPGLGNRLLKALDL
jgi:uncharacterized Ntn-hydrolase superfamily protein